MCNKAGFTMVEALVASAIITIVIAGSLAFYLMARSTWIVCSLEMPLQRKASLAMEKMVRGINGRNGIREASSASCPNSTTIEYTSGIDAKERSFYLNGSKITYDPDTDPLDSSPTVDIVEKVNNLTFTVSGSIVTINLGMQDTVKGKPINIGLQTKVRYRN